MHEEDDSSRTGLRFYFFDSEGNACRLSRREWMALHEDVRFRRQRAEDRIGEPPPHKCNARLAGRMVVVVEVLIATSNRRVRKTEHLRAFLHQFDEDGRLNVAYAKRHREASLKMQEKLFAGEDLSPAQNPLREFWHKLTTEEAALIRADLYRSKHKRKPQP